MVTSDHQGQSDLNNFLLNLDIETWSFNDVVEIKSRPNLRLLFQKKKEKKYAFYAYMGSDTTPPCSENVQRFILKNPISVPAAQLKELRMKTYKNDEEINGNSRKVYLF